ncbi:MAG TPA: glycosyltransferase family 87 protein, partial [Blastocatellia bacterium]
METSRPTSAGKKQGARDPLVTAKVRDLVCIGVLVLCVLAAGVWFAARSGADYRIYSNDFNVYYFASRQILSGHSPYDQRLGPWTPYIYPPLLAELIIPLALLPVPVAAYIWYLLNVAALAVAAVLAARLVCPVIVVDGPALASGHATMRGRLLTVAIAGASPIVLSRFALDSLAAGQVNAIITFLLIFHVHLYAKNRRGLSVLPLAFASVLKVVPVLFVFYHLLMGRIRYAIASASLIALIGVLSFGMLGGQAASSARTFYEQTIENGQGYDLSFSGNQSLRGAQARLIGESGDSVRKTSDLATSILSIGLFLLAAWSARHITRSEAGRYNGEEDRGALEAASAVPFLCLMVIVSPLSWKNHFIILLLPVAALLARLAGAMRQNSRPLSLWRTPQALALLLLVAAFDLTSPLIIGKAAAEKADSASVVFAGALLLYFVLVISNFR